MLSTASYGQPFASANAMGAAQAPLQQFVGATIAQTALSQTMGRPAFPSMNPYPQMGSFGGSSFNGQMQFPGTTPMSRPAMPSNWNQQMHFQAPTGIQGQYSSQFPSAFPGGNLYFPQGAAQMNPMGPGQQFFQPPPPLPGTPETPRSIQTAEDDWKAAMDAFLPAGATYSGTQVKLPGAANPATPNHLHRVMSQSGFAASMLRPQ